MSYDALLVVSFGGPEGPDDVMPFLRNVLRGRDVPEDRVVEVARQYDRFGGVSPLNGHNRALIAAIEADLASHGPALPVYWGNRNWHPMLADTVAAMAEDGVRRALAFVTSAYGGYSGCRQYLEDIEAARSAVGAAAPVIDKLRLYFNHPGFVEPLADQLRAARADAGPDSPVLFSAHSVPVSAAKSSPYEEQLRTTARLVAARAGVAESDWQLVFQSRSGSPSVPWLEPDVRDALAALAPDHDAVVVAPIGFTSDHMEVRFDLDTQAAETARQLGLRMVRAGTPGTDPRFVEMVRQLVSERLGPERPGSERLSAGGAVWPDRCPPGCCPAPARRPARPVGSGT
ncbi:ferrochelatase [Acidiferrimicrobium sp. IK]|uniref:ferrochelatase n=1 Tax=Acidiferrimicrobium sp. IK TaxID=2871700 RepID=UPI0021CB76A5|nr:ferrochelatase [Acidiferrimicrobium sp. IK]